MYGKKVTIRRKIEEAGIPYTYISSNAFAGYSLSNLVQFGKPSPPRDKVTIYGSGDAKGKVSHVTFITTSSTKLGLTRLSFHFFLLLYSYFPQGRGHWFVHHQDDR